jgi:hypothetical protein
MVSSRLRRIRASVGEGVTVPSSDGLRTELTLVAVLCVL